MYEYVGKNFEGNSLSIWVYPERDKLLTNLARTRLFKGYMTQEEKDKGIYQLAFARAAVFVSDSAEMAQRLYDAASKLWFMFSTPILANAGTARGDLISCFLNRVEDSRESILAHYTENGWLSSQGGGIGGYWGDLRQIGAKISRGGESTGVIPFIKVTEDLMMAFNQGATRRGSYAAYLPVWHPEITEFVEIRSQRGDDARRCRTTGFHHGVVIDDEFMNQLEGQLMNNTDEATYELRNPATGDVVTKVSPKTIWRAILKSRLETGEPYIMFKDTVDRAVPEQQKALGLEVVQSNLCSEITLPTGRDLHGNERTAVCCLSSVNIEKFEEWKDDVHFMPDLVRMLDNALTYFIKANLNGALHKAAYSAMRERSIGIGAMGFHAFLQSKNVPIDSVLATSWNKRIFRTMYDKADAASYALGAERGAAPDWEEGNYYLGFKADHPRRNCHLFAIAPNASSADIAGTSPGVEPYPAACYNKKTKDATEHVKNRHFREVLRKHNKDTPDVWLSIADAGGDLAHLDFLSDHEKEVFKPAIQLDQAWLVQHAADRQEFICQAQSLNLFYDPSHPTAGRRMHSDHMRAWKEGVKTLYYCRTVEARRAERVSQQAVSDKMVDYKEKSYDECLSCQG